MDLCNRENVSRISKQRLSRGDAIKRGAAASPLVRARHVFAPREREAEEGERTILASLTFFFCPFSCFEDFHQVRTAGGLEPLLWHLTSYVFPADRIWSFPKISTFSGFTAKTRFYQFSRYRRDKHQKYMKIIKLFVRRKLAK